MHDHPFVTVYKAKDGRWKATWMNWQKRKLVVFVFRKAGILTVKARRAWALAKNAELARAAARPIGGLPSPK